MTDEKINPRDVEPMSSSELNYLSNRLFARYEGREESVLEKDGSITIKSPYEPTLEDVTRLSTMVHALQRFKAADERNWHEEMFRRMDARFYRDESHLLHASLANIRARMMRDAALSVLALMEEGGGLEMGELVAELRGKIAKYDETYDKYFTDRELPKPDETPFLDRLRALIADEEVRQGKSQGKSTTEMYGEEREDLTPAQIATMKREGEKQEKRDE